MKVLIISFCLVIRFVSFGQVSNNFCPTLIHDDLFNLEYFWFRPADTLKSGIISTDFYCTNFRLNTEINNDTTIFNLSYSTENRQTNIQINLTKNQLDFLIFELDFESGFEVYSYNNYYTLYAVGEDEFVLSEQVYLGVGRTKSRNIYFKIS